MFEDRVSPLALHIDGVAHDLGDVAVWRTDPQPGGLPFSLTLQGAAAERLLEAVPGLRTGRPGFVLVHRILVALQPMLRNTGRRSAGFSVATLTEVTVGPERVRLLGTCSLALLCAAPPLMRRSSEE